MKVLSFYFTEKTVCQVSFSKLPTLISCLNDKKQLRVCRAPSFAFSSCWRDFCSLLRYFLHTVTSSAALCAHIRVHIHKCHHHQNSCTFYTLFCVVAPFEVSHIIITAFDACVVSAFNMPSHDFAPLIESVLVCL